MRIVFIGPPGSGKGTQCGLLRDRLAVPHISTGEMLRNLDGEGAVLIRSRIDRGQFAPDDFILRLVSDRLAQPDCHDGYLLDGFPRTLVQAEAFDRALVETAQSLDHVIEMVVDPEELVRRLAQRKQEGQRSDDSAIYVRERFLIYANRTTPLLDHYRGKRLVRRVDGMNDPKTVFEGICRAIGLQPHC